MKPHLKYHSYLLQSHKGYIDRLEPGTLLRFIHSHQVESLPIYVYVLCKLTSKYWRYLSEIIIFEAQGV